MEEGSVFMFDPSDIMDPIMEEAKRVIVEMKETKDLQKRTSQSEILRNLCHSIQAFVDIMSAAMLANDMPEFYEGEDEL